jgi:glycosyltransferase involved in cell wall biosynthesis
MASRKNIVVLTDWYLPAYKAGGPVRSLAALVFHLRASCNFYVITSNRDAFDEATLPVQANTWVEGIYGEKVMYLAGKVSQQRLQEVLDGLSYDYLYLNSFFSKSFSIYPLLLRKTGKIKNPVVLAPRGMLRAGALAIKPVKKKLFIAASKLRGLHDDLVWHATSEQEVSEIKKVYGPSIRVVLAPNLTLPPRHARSDYGKQPGELRVCTVARLVRNKKIDFALGVLGRISEGRITYDIYGPAEDPVYFEECRALAQKLPANIQVNFAGDVQPREVESLLQQHHVFLLPTETENFGHAIVEAMLNGCIPVISDRTPWTGLEAAGLGWDLPLDNPDAYRNAVAKCLLKSEAAFKAQSTNIQHFATTKTADPGILAAYQQLFK